MSTVDYDFIQAGLVVQLSLRESGFDSAMLDLEFSLSDLSGYTPGGEVPIVNRQAYESRTEIHSGGVYLLGSLDRSTRSDGLKAWLSYGQSSQQAATRLQLWARAYRVAPLCRTGTGGVPRQREAGSRPFPKH